MPRKRYPKYPKTKLIRLDDDLAVAMDNLGARGEWSKIARRAFWDKVNAVTAPTPAKIIGPNKHAQDVMDWIITPVQQLHDLSDQQLQAASNDDRKYSGWHRDIATAANRAIRALQDLAAKSRPRF